MDHAPRDAGDCAGKAVPVIYAEQPWTLASGSPRRLALLRLLGIEPRVIRPEVEEAGEGCSPELLVVRNAGAKAEAVAPLVRAGLLLAADTEVLLEGRIVGKPGDPEEARWLLSRLSGSWHRVITGYHLQWIERGMVSEATEVTRVHFRRLHPLEIEEYIESGAPFDKAGGYGIQGAAGAFVDRIEGCYFNVVGLPIAKIVAEVRHWLSPDGD